jgi:hypothetical protein
MAAATATVAARHLPELTLLDLVQAVIDEANTDTEVIATVLHLLRSGRVRLRGNFRGSLLEDT